MWNNYLEHGPIHCSLRLSAPAFWTTLNWAGRQHRIDETLAQIVADLKMEVLNYLNWPCSAGLERILKAYLIPEKKHSNSFIQAHILAKKKLFALHRSGKVKHFIFYHPCRCSGVRGGGASTCPKVLICQKCGQIPEHLGKNPEIPGTNDAKHCFTIPNGTQRLQKNAWKHFLEVTSKKRLHDLSWRKYVGKSHANTFRPSLGKFGQKSITPQNVCLLLHPPMTWWPQGVFRTAHAIFRLTWQWLQIQ